MQNAGIQAAKMAPAKQVANQNALVNSGTNSGANLGADNSVNSAPNAFAELLKKQVKQQKATDATDDAKATDATMAQTKSADDSVATDSTVLTDPTQTSKADTEQKTDEGLPAIQDLLLMQMGLQSAPQATTAAGATANSALSTDKEAGLPTTNALPVLSTGSGAEAKVADVTDKALRGDADSADKATPELAAEDKAKPLNLDQGISKTLVRDKEFKEVEMKATAVQLNNVAATSALAQSKMPDNVATSMMAASEIPTPFGRPEWNQAVNQRVMWMVGGGDQSATLTLNPPDLGPLQVVIQVDNDQVDTTFISDNPEVRQALQDGMNMLRDKMQDSGMQLGNAQVSSQAQSQRHFEQAMQQRAQQRLEQTTQAANAAEPTVSNTVVQRVSNGLVDTFA